MRVRLLSIAVVLAMCPAARADVSTWTATSTASMSVTGDITVSDSRIVFGNKAEISIVPVGPGSPYVYRVDPPANPVLANGNRLCSEHAAPTFIVLGRSDGAQSLRDSSSLYLKVFEGPEEPAAWAAEEMMGGGAGLCAVLNYEQAVSSPATGAAPPLAKGTVRQAQEILNALGYDAGASDGVAGPRTLRALAQFQKDNFFEETGRLDDEAFTSLIYTTEGEMGPLSRSTQVSIDAVSGPSFACNRAQTAVERTICADQQLSGLDAELAHLYRVKTVGLDGAASDEELQRQRRWIVRRDLCEDDAVCLRHEYETRISEMTNRQPEAPDQSDTATRAPTKTETPPELAEAGTPAVEVAELSTASKVLESCETCPERAAITVADGLEQSEYWAMQSTELLQQGRRTDAIIAALNGLPVDLTEADLPNYHMAHLALYSAARSAVVRLPLPRYHVGLYNTAISPDLTRVVTGGLNAHGQFEFLLWNALSGEIIATLIDDQPLGALSGGLAFQSPAVFSHDSRYVVMGGRRGSVQVFDSATGALTAQLPVTTPFYQPPDDNPYMTTIGFSPDGHKLVTVSSKPAELKVWNVPTFDLIASMGADEIAALGEGAAEHTEVIAKFANDETLCVAIGRSLRIAPPKGDLTIGTFDLNRPQFVPLHFREDAVPLIGGGVVDIECDPAVKLAAVHYGDLNSVRHLAVHDLTDDARQVHHMDHFRMGGLVFDDKGAVLAIAAQEGWLFLDVATGELVPHPGALEGFVMGHALAHAEDGGVNGDYSALIRLGSRKVFEPMPQGPALIARMRAELGMDDVEADPLDPRVVASETWARQSSELLAQGLRQEAIVAALKGLPDTPNAGDLARFERAYLALYTAVRSDVVRLPRAGVEVDFLGAILSFDASRAVIEGQASDGKRVLRLWDTASGTMLATLVEDLGNFYHYHRARAVFSEDGRHLAVAGTHGAILLFDAVDGSMVAELQAARPDDMLRGGLPSMSSMSFNPAGDRLLTAGSYHEFTIWSVPDGAPLLTFGTSDYDRLGTASAVATDARAAFVDDQTICLSVARTVGGSPGTELVVGAVDVPSGHLTKVARLDDVLSDFAGGTADITCSGDMRKFAVRYQNSNDVDNLEIIDLDRPGKAILFEHVQYGGGVFDATGGVFAVLTNPGWDFIELEVGELISQPDAPEGYTKTHPRVHSSDTGAPMSTDIVSEIHYGRSKIWEAVPTGAKLVAHAFDALNPELQVKVNSGRIGTRGKE